MNFDQNTVFIIVIAVVVVLGAYAFLRKRNTVAPTATATPLPRPHDMTVSTDNGLTNFSADTPKGEKFLGGPNRSMPSEEARAFQQSVEHAGLVVKVWP